MSNEERIECKERIDHLRELEHRVRDRLVEAALLRLEAEQVWQERRLS